MCMVNLQLTGVFNIFLALEVSKTFDWSSYSRITSPKENVTVLLSGLVSTTFPNPSDVQASPSVDYSYRRESPDPYSQSR
jgi:hypothetical protein